MSLEVSAPRRKECEKNTDKSPHCVKNKGTIVIYSIPSLLTHWYTRGQKKDIESDTLAEDDQVKVLWYFSINVNIQLKGQNGVVMS